MSISSIGPRKSNDSIALPLNLPAVRSRAKSSSSLTPTWFGMAELADAMIYMRSRIDPLGQLSANELRLRTNNVQKVEIGFISNIKFTDKNAAKKIFAETLAISVTKQPSEGAEELPARRVLLVHLSQLCEARLLSPAQETLLFQRMNFLRHQAAIQRLLLNHESQCAARLRLIGQLLALADWHRDRIIEANTRLVFSIIKKFVNESNRLEDLLSNGIVALFHAVNKFDFDRGFRFSTYATTVLRRNAYREVLDNQERRLKTVTGFDDMKIDLSDDRNDQPLSESQWQKLRGRLSTMLTELDRREKFIIRARFSLGSHRKVYTLQALANRLGVSKERVRQLEQRGLEKLQKIASKSLALSNQ